MSLSDETKKKISEKKTTYKKEYCEMIVDYFERTLSQRNARGVILCIPSYRAFARTVGVTLRTIENWRKKYKSFGEACEECDEMMKDVISSDALTFRMHANFAKFILSSRYGMREKVDIVDNEREITVPKELEELITQRKQRDTP